MNVVEYNSPVQTKAEVKNLLRKYPELRANMVAAEAELRDQEGKQKWICEQTENYTKFPNVLSDEIKTYLTVWEWRVLEFIVRRTEGFHKATDIISVDQFINGIVKKDGTRLDFGAGVTRDQFYIARKELIKAKIIFTIKAGKGVAYGLTRKKNKPFDGSLIDRKFLCARKEKRDEANRKRIAAARKKRAENLDKKRANVPEFGDGDF